MSGNTLSMVPIISGHVNDITHRVVQAVLNCTTFTVYTKSLECYRTFVRLKFSACQNENLQDGKKIGFSLSQHFIH